MNHRATVQLYTLVRYHRGRRMAQLVEVLAGSEAEALLKAAELFPEPGYKDDKFKFAAE